MAVLERLKNYFKNSSSISEQELEEDGNIKSMQVDPPFVKGVQRKYLYLLAGIFAVMVAGSLFWGLQEAPKSEEDQKENITLTESGPQHIEGSHMLNIPKNYTEKAVKDAKEHKDAPAETKFDRPKYERFAEPASPVGREYDRYSNQRPPREVSSRSVDNKIQKALESPIRFEINQ